MLRQMQSKKALTPAQLIVLTYIALILAGTLLLYLPFALKSGDYKNLLDALFTATSAVCVTGLTVVDTGTFYSSFGHAVILLLIQIGGLGLITVTTFYALLLGKRIGLRERVVLKQALKSDTLGGVVRLARAILMITLATEAIGAALLTAAFLKYFPADKALWYGIFHAVSAFCNSGFDILGQEYYAYSSLIPLQQDKLVLMIIAVLIVLGGLGFTVILDVLKKKRFDRLSLHSKLVIVSSVVLILFGMVFFFFTESGTLWGQMGVADRLTNSLFLSVTSRTAGFTTVDINQAVPATWMVLILLMFIGASPAGTGSGIKTTTFAVLFLAAKSRMQAQGDLVVYNRRIDNDTVTRAMTVTVVAIGVLFGGAILLSLLDPHDIMKLILEVFAGFGTGLSTGITPDLEAGAKMVLIFLMFFGRLGPLTLGFALLERSARKEHIKFPQGNVIIG
ncbi:MAG: Trk family potassium uptake protein [Syntrophomonadaceae bacterium]|nr:Trk family potassium uptake protein [Syntrophomonadaceae bacterium]